MLSIKRSSEAMVANQQTSEKQYIRSCDTFDRSFQTSSFLTAPTTTSTTDTDYSLCDLFTPTARVDLRRMSTQNSFFVDLGMITDSGSSGSTSLRDELYDPKKEHPLLFGDYLCKPSINITRRAVDHVVENPPTVLGSRLPVSMLSSELLSFTDIDHLPSNVLRQRLKNTIEVTRELIQHVNMMNDDLDKQRRVIVNLQSSLSAKEVDLREQNQRLTVTSQLCDAQATELGNLQRLLSRYQSASVKSTHVTDNSNGMGNWSLHAAVLTQESSQLNTRMVQEIKHQQLNDIPQQQVMGERRVISTSSHENIALGSYPSDVSKGTCRWEEENALRMNGKKCNLKSLDYRRMLDKHCNPDWDALIDQIIEDTDQQASIFLQQKLKCATEEQKESIIRSALKRLAALMTNRFGNFLVQRLLEMGTPEHIRALISNIQGHVVELTCDPFGCHVIQKALDSAEERIKSRLIIELFDAIPETITHKYACHVWQKVCAIQWTDESPQVMAHVHAELQGQWARVALDENGSLVIQNIFENLTEAEKKPVLEEVLADIVMIAKGQWGNWVVQHILEQADNNTDRQRAFQIVLNECIQLSMDQFASKVVEKALRIGGRMFLSQFIDQITTTSRSHRPRIALVDIASDQYGNYVVQWLLNNADDNQKICMSRLIKKHMVSLRGSKYGQRVAFLVEKVLRNLEVTTYPATPNTLL